MDDETDKIKEENENDDVNSENENDERQNQELRRSTRVRAEPSRFHDEFVNMVDQEPTSRDEALQRPDAMEWENAMLQEYQSLMENGTWTLTDLPKGRTRSERNGCSKSSTTRMATRYDTRLGWSPKVSASDRAWTSTRHLHR